MLGCWIMAKAHLQDDDDLLILASPAANSRQFPQWRQKTKHLTTSKLCMNPVPDGVRDK